MHRQAFCVCWVSAPGGDVTMMFALQGPRNHLSKPRHLLCFSSWTAWFLSTYSFFSKALDFIKLFSSFICLDLMGLRSAAFWYSAKAWFSCHSTNCTAFQYTCNPLFCHVLHTSCFWSPSLFPAWPYLPLFPFLPCHSYLMIGSLCMRKTRLEMPHYLRKW